MRVSLYRLERVALQHHLVPPFTEVKEEHLVSLLREAAQDGRGILVLRDEHVLPFEVKSYLYLQDRILPLEGRDCLIRVSMVPQTAQLELRPRVLAAASSAGLDRVPLSLFLFTVLLLLLLLHLITPDEEVEWYAVHFTGGALQQSRLEVTGSSFR